jgi:predicted peptidase
VTVLCCPIFRMRRVCWRDKSRDGHTMPYRLLRPENYDKTKRYLLVLALHGWGERGTDNNALANLAFFPDGSIRADLLEVIE